MLRFEPVGLDKKEMMERYFSAWGEMSCQHSFVSSFCYAGKYADLVCERDGWLYVMRSRRGALGESVWLFPQGDVRDRAGVRRAISTVLDHAHATGTTVRFETLTRRAMELTMDLFPGTFTVTEDRDMAEYVYSSDKLAELPGRELASKRYDLRTFWRTYGDRAIVSPIDASHIELMREHQARWYEARADVSADAVGLRHERDAIERGLDHFFELGLSGIVVLIDGRSRGFAWGAPLSPECYDVIIEKGDRDVPDIYRVLVTDLIRVCCRSYAWINREEDVGRPGLRKAKLSYRPDRMIEKFTLREDVR